MAASDQEPLPDLAGPAQDGVLTLGEQLNIRFIRRLPQAGHGQFLKVCENRPNSQITVTHGGYNLVDKLLFPTLLVSNGGELRRLPLVDEPFEIQ